MRTRLRTLILLGPLALGACGYALAGRGSFLPSYIHNIGVPQFTNNTPVFDVDRRVSERVRSELTRGKYKVFPTEAGMDAVLTGEITSIVIAPVSFTQQNQASRYVQILTAKVEFKDMKTGKVLWTNPAMQFREEFEPTTGTSALDPTAFFGQDTNALDRLATEFARSVVSALLEAF
jgi:outer membrane lipopolysaccharide assembly protein LptE/RlpB